MSSPDNITGHTVELDADVSREPSSNADVEQRAIESIQLLSQSSSSLVDVEQATETLLPSPSVSATTDSPQLNTHALDDVNNGSYRDIKNIDTSISLTKGDEASGRTNVLHRDASTDEEHLQEEFGNGARTSPIDNNETGRVQIDAIPESNNELDSADLVCITSDTADPVHGNNSDDGLRSQEPSASIQAVPMPVEQDTKYPMNVSQPLHTEQAARETPSTTSGGPSRNWSVSSSISVPFSPLRDSSSSSMTRPPRTPSSRGFNEANVHSSSIRLGLQSPLNQSTSVGSDIANSADGGLRSSVLASKLTRRPRLASSQAKKPPVEGSIAQNETAAQSILRRYKVGDYVLIPTNSSWAKLNRHGFPPGEGETLEECRGPYVYALATVKQVHFEEIHPYYTVTRCDTGVDQRANSDTIETIPTQRGIGAAKRASSEANLANLRMSGQTNPSDIHEQVMTNQTVNVPRGIAAWSQIACYFLLLPFLWLDDCMHYIWTGYMAPFVRSGASFCRGQSNLFLYGKEPYICRLRLTAVNFVVLCSMVFVSMDKIRLAFLPPASDLAIAALNFGVWIVLVFELIFEVFIRPNGYQGLIISDKAYAPTTVRFINFFHLLVESLSLAIFIPEFSCIFSGASCSERLPFSIYNALLMSVTGPTRAQALYGHAFIAITRLRVFGLVRHWKNMWITRTFINMTWHSKSSRILSNIVPPSIKSRRTSLSRKKASTEPKKFDDAEDRDRKNKDAALTNASNIGTALMATNSYRTLAIAWTVIGLFPVVASLVGTLKNDVARNMTDQLQAMNVVASDASDQTCVYLTESVTSWLIGVSNRRHLDRGPYLLTLDLRPPRCGFNNSTLTNVRVCEMTAEMERPAGATDICDTWSRLPSGELSIADVAIALGRREGSIVEHRKAEIVPTSTIDQDAPFSVVARFDETFSIHTAAYSSLLLQLCLVGTVLGGLSILRQDAEVLVLGPLRRMLKIVAHYARNPLVQPKVKTRLSHRGRVGSKPIDDETEWQSDGDSSDEDEFVDRELGSFETEQLITAVAKITDLLRKCWGVAGADIISTNLATREGALSEMFNPTVPGKSVYALFGFAVIGGFDNALRNIGGDVMPLINDVAAVLHGEVFRWGFGDSGQCNKNLGSAFLLVFRIGSVTEVIEKLEQATDVVFSASSGKRLLVSSAVRRRQTRRTTQVRSTASAKSSQTSSATVMERVSVAKAAASNIRKKAQATNTSKQMSLSLQSLPGISTFTDRAVIGMLKSYAGIHRDKRILRWNDDFRLGAGVGAFKISMIFGMDAGWAVEGAVGSEYKIDATYLSPHVNMASRMTSACKQYDVSIMLSQSVQELMSDVAQSKLRHVDTVTVKGSSVKQRIYTYDAKARGVDFFLYSRSDEQADFNADRYSPSIWTTDQDLIAMRQHVTDDFLQAFKEGLKAYIAGDWPTAIQKLERANDTMFQTAVDEGYLEDEFDALQVRAGEDVRGVADDLKRENGDGPSMYLLNFMKSHGGVAPKKWDGWHPLTRK